MSQLLGGAFIAIGLFITAGIIGFGKKLVHKMLANFKDEIISNLTEISADVKKVYKNVNDVAPGTPTMSKRVDRIEVTQTEAKQQLEDFIETTNTKFDSTGQKLDVTNASIEKLLESHVETRKKFDDAIKAIPKRKEDYKE
mgnify:CR=1 FL=1